MLSLGQSSNYDFLVAMAKKIRSIFYAFLHILFNIFVYLKIIIIK